MNAKEPFSSNSDYHLIKRNASETQVLSEQLETSLIRSMDAALQSICESLFFHEPALDAFSDLILDKDNVDEEVLDQWLTLRDIILLHQHLGKHLNQESKALICLAAQWVVSWPIDRAKLFDTINELETLLDPIEQALIHKLFQQYTDTRNKLVNANLRLVAHLAGRYRDKGLDTEELIQEGTLGVIQAANRFNASLGNRFTTYAYWWIQQALKQALSDKRGAVRLPTNVTDRISSIERHKLAYVKANGKEPNLRELHAFCGLDIQLLEQFQKIGNLGISLNAPVFDDDVDEKIDLLSDHSHPIQEQMTKWSLEKTSLDLLAELDARQALVIKLYHGLNTRQELTFREIAPILGITLERTRQIYHEGLKRLRENLSDQHDHSGLL